MISEQSPALSPPHTLRPHHDGGPHAALSPETVERAAMPIKLVREAIGRVVVGQESMIDGLLIGLLTGGHVLLEGVPGLAKTLTVSTLARLIHGTFKRIQFTPDLLPADLIGTLIYNPRDAIFVPRKGPVFANIVLADEINRAPAKVQSALLEAMQERQVTIGDETYRLPDPFLVMATQNPIEQEGTYPLPEAQVDRFMLKVRVGYPSRSQERQILDRMTAPPDTSHHPAPLLDLANLVEARALASRVHIDDRIRDYMVALVHATRRPGEFAIDLTRAPGNTAPCATLAAADNPLIEYGASPRATIALATAARARALLEGRGFVTPHDVKSVALEVLRHRVILSYEAEAQEVTPDRVVRAILDQLPAP